MTCGGGPRRSTWCPRELDAFDWLTHVQASPLTYLAVLGACALDAVLPIVLCEAAEALLARDWRILPVDSPL
jgi:hypothetical protein